MTTQDKLKIISQLEQIIEQRKGADADTSYVASLHQGGERACGDKVLEEAQELVEAALGGERQEVVHEAADLLFHIQVLLSTKGVSVGEVCDELKRRFGTSGHEEKRNR